MNLEVGNIYLYIVIILTFWLVPNYGLIGQTKVLSEGFEQDYVHTNFTTKDGLPSNEVYVVFQDSKGYIWLGTDKGVVKYDGYTFITFTTQDGLLDNTIFDIKEDSEGNIWFTTFNMKLCYYKPGVGIKAYAYNDKILLAYKQRGNVSSGFFDQIDIGENDTLYLSNFELGYLEIPLKNDGVINNYLFNTFNVSDPLLWIVTKPNYNKVFTCGINYFGECEQLTIKHNNEILDTVSAMINYHNEARPYGIDENTYYFAGFIIKLFPDKTIKVSQLNKRLHIFKIRDKFLINHLDDGIEKGHVYLATDVTDVNTWEKIINDKIRLAPSIQDINGGMWLGSIEHGVYFVPNLYNKVVLNDFNLRGMIPYMQGTVIYERNDKICYYENNRLFQLPNKQFVMDSIPIDQSTDFYKLSHPIITRFNAKWKLPSFLKSRQALHGVAIKNRRYYAVLRRTIIECRPNFDIKLFYHLNEVCTSAEFTDSNELILGTENGIYILEEKRARPYLLNQDEFKLKAQDIKRFKKSNILAVATVGNGLFLFKDRTLYKQITVNDGLVSNTINQLLLDHKDRLWIGTNKGVNRINIDEEEHIIVNSLFASSRSLISPNVLQMVLEQDSLMLIGTDDGVNKININALERRSAYEIPIFITDVMVNDTLPFRNRLEYNENSIKFHYTALEYNVFGNIEYRYRLKGVSDQWIYTKDRKATFFNLQPNEYSFELEVKSPFGKWIKSEDKYAFEIDKPYWNKWWFIGSYIFVGLFILGGVFYYYISNLKKEKELIEDKQLLSEELNESRQKALSSQLNPHFVFNSLNSIQNFILTKRKELSSDYLSTFSKLMRFVFENSKKLYVPLLDEIEALKLYLELEQVRHNNKFEYILEYDRGEINRVSIPSLLVQPIIENAIWHGLLHKQEGSCLLTVSFIKETEYLRIEVNDNGVGRQSSKPRPKFIKKQRSSGVELTKQRLNLLSQSTGLNTRFEIIDLFDQDEKPSGTTVIISIPLNLSS